MNRLSKIRLWSSKAPRRRKGWRVRRRRCGTALISFKRLWRARKNARRSTSPRVARSVADDAVLGGLSAIARHSFEFICGGFVGAGAGDLFAQVRLTQQRLGCLAVFEMR